MMKKYLLLIVLFILPVSAAFASGRFSDDQRLKPAWMKKKPTAQGMYEDFVHVTVYSGSHDRLYTLAMGALYEKLPTLQKIRQTGTLHDKELTGATLDGEQYNELKIEVNGQEIAVNCRLVDSNTDDQYTKIKYDALYQVKWNDSVPYSPAVATNKYSPACALLSIVPGVGQFYKGDPLKGGLFLGGTALLGLGSAFTFMQSNVYATQIGQTHDINVIRQLDAKRQNFAIAGGVMAGTAAVVWLWNIIDAAIAPGARHIVFTGNSLQYNF